MQKNKVHIHQLKHLLTFKTFFKIAALVTIIFFSGIVASQISKNIFKYRYSSITAYCESKHRSLQESPSLEQLNRAHIILNSSQLEFMPIASLYFEQAIAHDLNTSKYIEPLLQTYLFRLEYEIQSSFSQDILTLSDQLIQKNKKSLYGHAFKIMLQIHQNNDVKAESYLQEVSNKHIIHKILDYKISQLKDLDSGTLFKKLDAIQKSKQFEGLYEKNLYELYIVVGDYFSAKPILNERLIRFPNDVWAQNQIAKLLQKGENINRFDALMQAKQLQHNNATIQLAYANTKCTQISFSECVKIYKDVISGRYDFNSRNTLIEAYFKLTFYYAKNNQLNQAYKQLESMKKLFPESLKNIALYEAFICFLDEKTLPTKTMLILKEETFHSEDRKISQFFLAHHFHSNSDFFKKHVSQSLNSDHFFTPSYLLNLLYMMQNNQEKSVIDLATKYLFQAQVSGFHIQNSTNSFQSLLIERTLRKLKKIASRHRLTQNSAMFSAFIGLMHLNNYFLSSDTFDLNQSQYYLNRALTKVNTNEKIYLLLGIVEHYKNNMYASELFLNKSYALQEDNPNTLFWFAKNKLSQKKASLAEPMLKKLLSYQQWRTPAMNLLILLQLQKNQNQDALLNLKGLLMEYPNAKESWRTLNLIEF